MEADVNVLVVGSSTARSGAIGRHFLFPLIRRCCEALAATLPSGRDWTSEEGDVPTEQRRGCGVGRREVFVCGGGGGGVVNLPFLFINMADLSQRSAEPWNSSCLPLPSPTWRKQFDPSLSPKREWDYCISLAAVLGAIKKKRYSPPSLSPITLKLSQGQD